LPVWLKVLHPSTPTTSFVVIARALSSAFTPGTYNLFDQFPIFDFVGHDDLHECAINILSKNIAITTYLVHAVVLSYNMSHRTLGGYMQPMFANPAYSTKRGKDVFMYFRDILIYPRWIGLKDEVFKVDVVEAREDQDVDHWGWFDSETQKISHITHDRIALTMDLNLKGLDHKKGRLIRVAINNPQKIYPANI
jgi:hypothetical protein